MLRLIRSQIFQNNISQSIPLSPISKLDLGKKETVMSSPNPEQGSRSQALYPKQPISTEEYNKIVTDAKLTSSQANKQCSCRLRTFIVQTFFEATLRDKHKDLAKSFRLFYKINLINIDSVVKAEILNPNGKALLY